MYFKGQVVNRDYKQALKWYLLAADQNDAKAQFILGVLYRRGLGGDRDHKKAFNWFLLSAEQDYAIAQFTLSGIFENGDGVIQNCVEAI